MNKVKRILRGPDVLDMKKATGTVIAKFKSTDVGRKRLTEESEDESAKPHQCKPPTKRNSTRVQ